MNKITKSVLIPVAAFAVTVTGVSAFSSEVLEEVGLTNDQISAFESAHELKQAGEHEEAKEVLMDAEIDRDTIKEVRTAMKEHRSEVRAVIEAALEDGDYNDFMDAIADTPLAEHIDGEDDFDLFLKAYELKQSGDREAAREIMDELGIEKPEHRKGGHGMKGDRGGHQS